MCKAILLIEQLIDTIAAAPQSVSYLAFFRRYLSMLLFLLPVCSWAQDGGGASIDLGETDLTPSVRLDYVQNNNAFLTNSNTTEITGFLIKPSVKWVADRRLLSLVGTYKGEFASMSESALNYADHSFEANAEAALSSRKRVVGNLQLRYDHQALGRGITRGFADASEKQIEFFATELQAAFIYGANKARGNIEFGLEVESVAYQNRADLTSGRGFTQISPYGLFSLRVSGDTRALLELKFGRTSFGRSSNNRDDISVLVGMKFAATGKSGGEFRVGSTFSSFESAGRDDKNNVVATAALFFEPTTYSRFELTLERGFASDTALSFNSSDGSGISDEVALRWRHDCSSRLFHIARVGYEGERRGCPDSDIDVISASLELNLSVLRWLQVGGSFGNQTRSASVCSDAIENDADLDYDVQTFGVHVKATL